MPAHGQHLFVKVLELLAIWNTKVIIKLPEIILSYDKSHFEMIFERYILLIITFFLHCGCTDPGLELVAYLSQPTRGVEILGSK